MLILVMPALTALRRSSSDTPEDPCSTWSTGTAACNCVNRSKSHVTVRDNIACELPTATAGASTPVAATNAAASPGSGRLIKRVLPTNRGGPALQGNDLVAPQTRFQTRISARRRVAFGSLPLDDVKTIKNTFGCTVNGVVLAICAAGLRSWLDERGELPAESLLGFIPVSVRTPEQMGTFGNQVSVMIAELPTEMADPVQRLRRINDTMKDAKERHRAVTSQTACPTADR
jgi:hypothetical protein